MSPLYHQSTLSSMLTTYSDASGAEKKEVSAISFESSDVATDIIFQETDTSTAILKKKKKPNSLMYIYNSVLRNRPPR